MSPALTAIGTPCSACIVGRPRRSSLSSSMSSCTRNALCSISMAVADATRVGGVAAERPAGGQAQRRPDALPVRDRWDDSGRVEVPLRLALRHGRQQAGERRLAIARELA